MGRWDLTPVINASGTMTTIGASRVHPVVADMVRDILGEFVSIAELQSHASAVIARATGAEAGCIAHCSAAGITTCVAACIARDDLAVIERLPDTCGKERRVAVPMGHMINYGAPIPQAVALAGACPVALGTAAMCETYHLRAALKEGCAAALYVVSHHTVREGELPLDLFVEICHEHDVPVIVDMAAEYDLLGPIALGADLVVYSGHKFLGGPTSGIIAGSRDLVRAVHLQHRGIGRCMKVGKESIVGAMAALELWQARDAEAHTRKETAIIEHWLHALSQIEGLSCSQHQDWTGNPVIRLKLQVDPDRLGLFAWELAERLTRRDPSIVLRDDLVEHQELYLDPCNLDEKEAEIVGFAIFEEIEGARRRADGRRTSWSEVKRRRETEALSWPLEDRSG